MTITMKKYNAICFSLDMFISDTNQAKLYLKLLNKFCICSECIHLVTKHSLIEMLCFNNVTVCHVTHSAIICRYICMDRHPPWLMKFADLMQDTSIT